LGPLLFASFIKWASSFWSEGATRDASGHKKRHGGAEKEEFINGENSAPAGYRYIIKGKTHRPSPASPGCFFLWLLAKLYNI
jgi:hypothetical protein